MVGISHFDHGSGTGEVLRAIGSPDRAARVVALEPNTAMNERFNEVYGHFENVSLFEGTLDTYMDVYPAESGHEPFDLVTSQLVLPFVADPFREL